MILILHIVTAILSLGYTTYLYINPSKSKLNTSYVLTTATLASGTYLVASTHANLLQTCTMGLLYISVTIAASVSAKNKLIRQSINKSLE